MRIPRGTTVVLLVATLVLVGCPNNGGGTATITLRGDASCTPPVTVTGTVTKTNGGTSLLINSTVKCNGAGVSGVTMDGRLPLPTGDKTAEWGPTDGNGQATTTLDVSAVPALPASFHVIVKDSDGNVVKDEAVTIQ